MYDQRYANLTCPIHSGIFLKTNHPISQGLEHSITNQTTLCLTACGRTHIHVN